MRGRLTRRTIARFLATQLEGSQRKDAVRHVAAYLLEHRAAKEASMMASDVAQVLASRRQHLFATATVARPLSHRAEQAIKVKLASESRTASVELAVVVSLDIIGGIIIETPDQVQDASVRTALKKLQAIT